LDGNAADTYVSYGYNQTGPTNLPDYLHSLYFDDDLIAEGSFNGPVPPAARSVLNYGPLTVRGGRHTFISVSDRASAAPETSEVDNSASVQAIWSPLLTTWGTPLIRPAAPPKSGIAN